MNVVRDISSELGIVRCSERLPRRTGVKRLAVLNNERFAAVIPARPRQNDVAALHGKF